MWIYVVWLIELINSVIPLGPLGSIATGILIAVYGLIAIGFLIGLLGILINGND